MAFSGALIECPYCGNHVQDTKQEYINCRFCGKSFKRGTIAKEKEEELRRNMVLDLSDEIAKMKVISSVGQVFGTIFIIFFIILLFSDVFLIIQLVLTVIFLANGVFLLAFGLSKKSKLDKKQSKLFDLTGGRAVFEY